jgi:uncharacterized coiled-coil protein SlyX
MATPDPLAAVRAIANLPNIVPALQKVGDLAPGVERIAAFGETLEEIARVVPSLEALARLEETLDDLTKIAPALEALAALTPVLVSLEQAISHLEVTIGSVSDTLAPLQGTTQRLGRVVDRFGSRKAAAADPPSESEPAE